MLSVIYRAFCCVLIFCLCHVSFSDYKDDVGYTQLAALLGLNTPTGAGVLVAQIEAPSGSATAYLPDKANSQFAGVTINNASGIVGASASSHATTVGQYFFGNQSIAKGITSVNAYEAENWLTTLANGTHMAGTIQNHSWVGTAGSSMDDKLILSSLDYSIKSYGYIVVAGVDNYRRGNVLLSRAYNLISVGVTKGSHDYGVSPEGVQYPNIVAPATATSYATPIVSAASAILLETARNKNSINGQKSTLIKSVLMAGATKDECANWSHTQTSPLDNRYGAGQLNIYNSYFIMDAGEQSANSQVSATGWDYNTMASGADDVSYSFNIYGAGDISIALTWDADYTYIDGDFELSLANLDLFLYKIVGDEELLIAQSIALSGNVEYIWATDLYSGDYEIRVISADGITPADYALSWQSFIIVPEPGMCATILGLFVLGAVLYRRCGRERLSRTLKSR